MAVNLGKALDLTDSELDQLVLLAELHDIGKIAIASQILTKPGSLSEQEWEHLQQHPEIGYRIVSSSFF